MNNVIDFLEKIGQDPQWRHASPDQVEQALAGAKIAPELQMAILARDQVQLEKLLGQTPFCAPLFPGQEEEEDGEEDEESPAKEPDEILWQSLQSGISVG
jgi:hypothetical protein